MLATIIALAATASPATLTSSPVIQRNKLVVDKSYPAESALRGEQGDVTFRIRTNRKGQIDSCQVTRSSGYRRLDEATCDMILNGATAKPLQDANGLNVAGVRDAYVEWRLPARFAVNQAAFDTKPGRPGVAYECHREMRKGSIIVQQKICMTAEAWNRQIIEAQYQTRAYQKGPGSGL